MDEHAQMSDSQAFVAQEIAGGGGPAHGQRDLVLRAPRTRPDGRPSAPMWMAALTIWKPAKNSRTSFSCAEKGSPLSLRTAVFCGSCAPCAATSAARLSPCCVSTPPVSAASISPSASAGAATIDYRFTQELVPGPRGSGLRAQPGAAVDTLAVALDGSTGRAFWWDFVFPRVRPDFPPPSSSRERKQFAPPPPRQPQSALSRARLVSRNGRRRGAHAPRRRQNRVAEGDSWQWRRESRRPGRAAGVRLLFPALGLHLATLRRAR